VAADGYDGEAAVFSFDVRHGIEGGGEGGVQGWRRTASMGRGGGALKGEVRVSNKSGLGSVCTVDQPFTSSSYDFPRA